MNGSLEVDLRRALRGDGPAIVLPRDPEGPHLPLIGDDRTGGDRIVLIAWTSGSTGDPKAVALDRSALEASAARTEEHLGGPGSWLLALPLHHIAGAQVVLRAARTGAALERMPAGPFTAAGFTESSRQLVAAAPGQRHYTSLVPTQLQRVLADGEAREAAAGFAAILVGGASVHPRLTRAAEAAGLRLVRTYGMTETCGGAVYDGHPLPGVDLRIEADGRVRLSGPVVGAGYARLDSTSDAVELTGLVPFDGSHDDTRTVLTSDLGRLDDGVLSILGRSDDAIISGGENIPPHAVETAALSHLPHIDGALLAGVEDPEWGERAVLLLSGSGAHPGLDQVRGLLRPHLPAAWLPRAVHVLDSLPQRGIGKPDRGAAARLAAELERSTMESRASTEE